MALRAEKKAATRTAIADAALGLFLARGFDRVTVAEVADAARVSVNTAFNYFPTKEDLFFDRQDEVVQRLAGAVRGRAPGESPVAAARRLFLEELDRGEPTLGLSPDVGAFWKVIEESPALQARARLLAQRAEEALAAALDGGRWQAAMLVGVDRALHALIRDRMRAGADPAAVRAEVRAEAEAAFAALSRALDADPAEAPETGRPPT
ncbi:TetR/AcrR family transcriptional regulator [Dactylosporangium aurantiacum]|uniref:TetR/AcrR family transcriptional regulator n=1 Tax=Dactylosporangium aurantiacum TaxID=35754 RepID=A0A9Q9MHN9_9ACTN|nr:TetR/AcrR family transcriptional regulator [Dactylosporangium aurantiacum]MDG6105714.1 helix-turn-helix domain containing protein [Dactylosporangium aurantiacum]UWZ56964.1 TetR/AcrR family transcriptional regulator [Dactylosporangium aurantiacum]